MKGLPPEDLPNTAQTRHCDEECTDQVSPERLGLTSACQTVQLCWTIWLAADSTAPEPKRLCVRSLSQRSSAAEGNLRIHDVHVGAWDWAMSMPSTRGAGKQIVGAKLG